MKTGGIRGEGLRRSDMEVFFTQLINGLNVGSIYALIALGYTMVYGIAKMLNFAHGDIIMVGAYTIFVSISSLHMPPYLAILIGIVVCAVFGIVIEKVAYKPLRNASSLTVLITAIGVSYLLQSASLLIFGDKEWAMPTLVSFEGVTVGGVKIPGNTIITLVATVVIMVGLTLFINKTKAGKAMLAVSEDKGAAELMGINVNRTISLTFAIGSALAAVAGALYANSYVYIKPTMGAMTGIKAFIAAVIGGIGSIPGAMVGGIALGLVESLSKAYISTQMSDAIVFGILILVLLVRPSGLLGRKHIEKV